jgi:protein TonB
MEPANDASFANEFLQTVAADVHSSVSPTTDILQLSQPPRNDANRIVEESNDTVKPLMATRPPTLMAQPQPGVSPQMPSTTETTPITRETLLDEQPKTNIAATPVRSEPSAQPMSPIEQEFPPTPAPSVANAAMTTVQSRDPSPVPALPASSPAASGQSSTSQTDYSWLQRAVSRRLEELKRSSRPSLDDSSRLKVLVKAVVSSTGELMEAEVVKSSGLERIDQAAMTLVQRAFPMQFDYAIDRPQIVMRIPITYSRD